MWLPRQLAALQEADRPVVLLGGEAHGTPFVIDALRARERAAWWSLTERSADDDVAQGNELAEALNRLLGAPLFPLALPFRAHLQALRHHAEDLRPLWLAVTTEAPEAPLLAELVGLTDAGYGVVIDLRAGGRPAAQPWLDACIVIGSETLRLTPEEAKRSAPGGLSGAEVEALRRETNGRFSELLAGAYERAGLPPLVIPGPDGPLLPQGQARPLPNPVAVRALARDGAWVDALELAVLGAPDMVDDLLRTAGPAYQERGLMRRLHLLLSALPPAFQAQERVLEWRLLAALDAGELAAAAPDVDAYLETHVAADLRARRAGTLPRSQGFGLAEEAVGARRTPLTLWQFGRLHPDPAASARLLEESVRAAEEVGRPYDVARSAGTLAAKLLHLGEFSRARAWAHYALGTFDQHGLRDGARRLRLLNDLAFARLLTGDLAGLPRLLADAAASLEGAMPAVADLFRSTWAAVELVNDDPETAHRLVHRQLAAAPRSRRAPLAQLTVRVLLELGRVGEAAVAAEDAVELARGGEDHDLRVARLARGMVGTVAAVQAGAAQDDPAMERARDDLLEVIGATEMAAEWRLPAALHYLVASGGAAHHLPSDVVALLTGLHPAALRLFGGPTHVFAPVWDSLTGDGPALRLRFFGGAGCRLEGVQVDLPVRLAEAALALTLHPQGLAREELNAFLTPDGKPPYTAGGLRGLLTRLRGVLPVSEAPYRWGVAFAADVVEAEALLADGRVREAIALWRGPLLPASDAPGVCEARESLEEALRQAALLGRDPDALFELADRLSDDLELWEAAASAMPPGDPRLALALARTRRLAREYG